MFESITRHIRKGQIEPGISALFLNPFYFARKGLFTNIASLSKYITGKTLDVGCGQKPYEKLFLSSQYIGLELDTEENRRSKKADLFYDGQVFPFPDSEFDSIVSNEVFEHIFHPDKFLCEINRVLRPGGILLITVPFAWDEHEQPNDYARYSSFGLRSIIENHGFQILESRKSMNDIRAIFQLLNCYIYKKTATKNNYLNLLSTFFLIAPINVLGEFLAIVLPKNDDLYLDNVILARKTGNTAGGRNGG
jgi:SAM-dependent methyltransferase